MRLPLAVLADYANVSAEGKLNIMGIFNTISAAAVPLVHPQMRLILRFQSEPADRGQSKAMEIKLLDADGHELLSLKSMLNLPSDVPLTAEFPQILELNSLRFEQFGDFAFHILVNGETKATIPFTIAQRPSQVPRLEG